MYGIYEERKLPICGRTGSVNLSEILKRPIEMDFYYDNEEI